MLRLSGHASNFSYILQLCGMVGSLSGCPTFLLRLRRRLSAFRVDCLSCCDAFPSICSSLPLCLSPFSLYSVTTAALVTANFTPVLQSYRSWSPFPLELPTSFLLNQDKVSFLSSSCSWAPVSRSNKTILQKKFKPHFLHLCPRILTHVPKRHCKYNPYCKYLNHYVQILKLHKRLSVMKKIY